MGTPVTQDQFQPSVYRNLHRPFESVIENHAAEGVELALIPREEIQAIVPRYPIWLFPPDLVHTPEATPADAFNPNYEKGGAGMVEHSKPLSRSIKEEGTRGLGRVAARPTVSEITGAPRNVSGPV